MTHTNGLLLNQGQGETLVGPTTPLLSLATVDEATHGNSHCLVFQNYNLETLGKGLIEIAEGRKLAALYENVLSPSMLQASVRNLETHQRKELYEGADCVGRIGNSLYETQFGPEHREQYFAKALESSEAARDVFYPYASPIDQLRTMCDELPSFEGANLLRVEDGIGFAGLIRYLDNGARILPHTDNAAWDMPDSLICQQIDVQIAFNAHLQAATTGGEVTVYGRRPSKAEYDAYREDTPNQYAIKPDVFRTRSVTIHPKAGDLVLFNASLPHEVAETTGDTRYTSSCFIGINRDRKITLFS